MNNAQKSVLALAMLAALIMLCVPPWTHTANFSFGTDDATAHYAKPAGYALIWNPPAPLKNPRVMNSSSTLSEMGMGVQVDVSRLVAQLMATLIVAGSLTLIFQKSPNATLRERSNAANEPGGTIATPTSANRASQTDTKIEYFGGSFAGNEACCWRTLWGVSPYFDKWCWRLLLLGALVVGIDPNLVSSIPRSMTSHPTALLLVVLAITVAVALSGFLLGILGLLLSILAWGFNRNAGHARVVFLSTVLLFTVIFIQYRPRYAESWSQTTRASASSEPPLWSARRDSSTFGIDPILHSNPQPQKPAGRRLIMPSDVMGLTEDSSTTPSTRSQAGQTSRTIN